jgi:hypothetical protein
MYFGEKTDLMWSEVVPGFASQLHHLPTLQLRQKPTPQVQFRTMLIPKDGFKINSLSQSTGRTQRGYSIIHRPSIPFKLEINNLLANRNPRETHFHKYCGICN